MLQTNLLTWLLVFDLGLMIIVFVSVARYRKQVGFQLGMNIAMVSGGMTALFTGIVLSMHFPFFFTEVLIISSLVGMASGVAFGGLFDYQTLLTGLVNGFMMGIMAPMVGAIITERLMFAVYIEVIFALAYVLIFLSVRKP